MAAPPTRALLASAVYVLPLCFAVGLALNEWSEAQRRLDALVEKRVQQRLGEWTPPQLRDEVRSRGGGGGGGGGRPRACGVRGGGATAWRDFSPPTPKPHPHPPCRRAPP